VPLSKGVVEKVEYCSYDLESIGKLTDGVEFDYCLIDGPSVSGYDGRFATLPLVRKYLGNEGRFVLDDALRSNELLIAEKWNQLPYIKIQEIVLTPKGLLVGFMKK
jgi:hypothetical protein